MKRTLGIVLSLALLVPLLRSQGLDEINVIEMNWTLRCYLGVRSGTAPDLGVVSSSYSKPAFLENLGKDEDLAKERELIKTTFNLGDVRPISQGEIWLKEAQASGLVQIVREKEKPLAFELERLDTSWLHYRVTVYELNAEKKIVMRSAFTVPSSMTLREAVVFGFEDSARTPLFLSLRIGNLYADGKDARKEEGGKPAEKTYALAEAVRKEEFDKKVKEFESGAVACRGDIRSPRLKSATEPEYPKEAAEKGIEGQVILALKVNETGRVIDAMVLRSVPEFDRAALEAVKGWVFEPLLIEGKPRTCVFTCTVGFNLEKLRAAKKRAAEPKPAVTAPRLTHYVPAAYPEQAKAKGITGTVVLSVTLDTGGNVIAAKVLKSLSAELDQAAIDAVKQWKYEPMTIDGKPRGVVFTVSVDFKR